MNLNHVRLLAVVALLGCAAALPAEKLKVADKEIELDPQSTVVLKTFAFNHNSEKDDQFTYSPKQKGYVFARINYELRNDTESEIPDRNVDFLELLGMNKNGKFALYRCYDAGQKTEREGVIKPGKTIKGTTFYCFEKVFVPVGLVVNRRSFVALVDSADTKAAIASFVKKQKALEDMMVMAVGMDYADIAAFASGEGISLGERDQFNRNILYHCLANKNNDLLEQLLANGFDPESPTEYFLSFPRYPIDTAVSSRNLQALRILLKAGAKLPDYDDKDRRHPAVLAIEYNYAELLPVFLEAGVDFLKLTLTMSWSSTKYTALEYAKKRNYPETIEFLRSIGIQ